MRAGKSEPRAPRVGHVHARRGGPAGFGEKTWEKATVGKAVTDFRRYAVSATFREGDLVRHSKFGDGFVTRIVDAGKVEVMFKDETRMLAQGMSA